MTEDEKDKALNVVAALATDEWYRDVTLSSESWNEEDDNRYITHSLYIADGTRPVVEGRITATPVACGSRKGKEFHLSTIDLACRDEDDYAKNIEKWAAEVKAVIKNIARSVYSDDFIQNLVNKFFN